jgi:hypothetical protein
MRYFFGLIISFSLLSFNAQAQVKPSNTFQFPYGNMICGAGNFDVIDCQRINNGVVNLPANLNVTKNLVLNGVGNGNVRASDSIIFYNGNVTGTCNNGGANCPTVDIVSNVGVVSVGTSIAEGIRCLSYLRAAQNGSYVCGDFITQLNNTTVGSSTSKNYVGLNAGFNGAATDLGNGFGFGTNCILFSNVTMTTCSGAEADIALQTNSSATYFYGWGVLVTATNAVAATGDSAAHSMGLQIGATATLSCGYCSGYSGNASPLSSTADYIAHHGSGTKPSIANGINFNGWTFSGSQILFADGITAFTSFGSLLFNASRQIAWTGGVTLSSQTSSPVLELQAIQSNGTPATLTGTCTHSTVTGGATAGTFTATCTSQTIIIALPTSTNGWHCSASDLTTPTDTLNQTASSTASATLTGTTVGSDTIEFHCMGF